MAMVRHAQRGFETFISQKRYNNAKISLFISTTGASHVMLIYQGSIQLWLVFKKKKTQYLTFFISQPYFEIPKTIRLNATHFIMKILNKREPQQKASNHLSDSEFKGFMKLYKDYGKEQFSIFSEWYNFTIR